MLYSINIYGIPPLCDILHSAWKSLSPRLWESKQVKIICILNSSLWKPESPAEGNSLARW